MNFEHLDKKKKKLDAIRPFPEHSLKSLRKNLIVEWTYNSNAIEGNTLTLQETKVVLEEGITIGGKSLREHLEATTIGRRFYMLRILSETKSLFPSGR